jgi:hypothetical protein
MRFAKTVLPFWAITWLMTSLVSLRAEGRAR